MTLQLRTENVGLLFIQQMCFGANLLTFENGFQRF